MDQECLICGFPFGNISELIQHDGHAFCSQECIATYDMIQREAISQFQDKLINNLRGYSIEPHVEIN
jgi:hypothetical protein